MKQVVEYYFRYYGLRIMEIFRRIQARKRMWQIYWEAVRHEEDICLRDQKPDNSDDILLASRILRRKIRDHIIVSESRRKK